MPQPWFSPMTPPWKAMALVRVGTCDPAERVLFGGLNSKSVRKLPNIGAFYHQKMGPENVEIIPARDPKQCAIRILKRRVERTQTH